MLQNVFNLNKRYHNGLKKINHICFIMDGNRRWAKHHRMPTQQGHYFGLKRMVEIAKFLVNQKIPGMSFFAFSTENWNRKQEEVDYLVNLLDEKISSNELEKWIVHNNVQFVWNGFEDLIPKKIIYKIKYLMDISKNNSGTKLQIMFNYGSQQKILAACNNFCRLKENITQSDIWGFLDPLGLGPVDLLIRTGGEKRISNFMLYEIAYSEIIFQKKYWPSYTIKKLKHDIAIYGSRDRRFGK